MAQPLPDAPILSSDTAIEEKHTVLYMGREKSGKTHNCCTWPKPLVVLFDPNVKTLTKFPGVQYILLDRKRPWAHFQWKVQPKIQNREYDCETLVVDSWSFAFDALISEVKASGLTGYDLWASVFEKGMSAVSLVIDSAKPDPYRPGLRSYHVLGTVHEQPETDEKGNLVEVLPAIGGQSRTRIARMFNTVLITQCEMEVIMGQGGQPATRKPHYFCWSIPPDRYRACGDGVGGGKYNVLPPKVEGTYQGLMKAWGISTENDTSPSSSG